MMSIKADPVDLEKRDTVIFKPEERNNDNIDEEVFEANKISTIGPDNKLRTESLAFDIVPN